MKKNLLISLKKKSTKQIVKKKSINGIVKKIMKSNCEEKSINKTVE